MLTVDIPCEGDQLPITSFTVGFIAVKIILKQLHVVDPVMGNSHSVNYQTLAIVLKPALVIGTLEEEGLRCVDPDPKQLPVKKPANVSIAARGCDIKSQDITNSQILPFTADFGDNQGTCGYNTKQ